MDGINFLYAPFAKIDLEKREVYGYATTPTKDQQGETILLSAVEAALPDYLKAPAVREMHQPSAVGTGIAAKLDQTGLWFGAKVIDDSAWNKVKSGVYRGFSIGGRVTERDDFDKSIIKGIDLVEISLVDRPCNPDATFQLIKRATSQDWAESKDRLALSAPRHFASGKFGSPEQIKASATEHANRHEALAEEAIKEAGRHKARAEAAKKTADSKGVVLHSQLAMHNEVVAQRHRATAQSYRAMAEQHMRKIQEIPMSNKSALEKAMESASAAMEALAKVDANSFESLHPAIIAAHEQAKQNDAIAIAHVADATRARADANMARADGKDDEGKHKDAEAAAHESAAEAHHAAASTLHAMVMHHIKAVPGHVEHGTNQDTMEPVTKNNPENAPGITSEAQQSALKGCFGSVMQHCADHADKCMKAAGDYNALKENAQAKGMGVNAESHKDFAEHLQKCAGERDAMAKDAAGVLQERFKDVATDPDNAETFKFIKGSKLIKIGSTYYTIKGNHFVCKRDFTDEKRKELADSGKAMPDGSFPIENKEDLHNAVQAHGRAKDPEKAKAHIVARAKALGAESSLPEGWGAKVNKTVEVGETQHGAAQEDRITQEGDGAETVEKAVFKLAQLASMLSYTKYFKNNLVAKSELSTWAETGIALLTKKAKEEAKHIEDDADESSNDDDDDDDGDDVQKAIVAAHNLLHKENKPYAWIKAVSQLLEDDLGKSLDPSTKLRKMTVRKQFKKGCRHLKKAAKRMEKVRQQQMIEKGYGIAKAETDSNFVSTTSLPVNQGKPGATSPDAADTTVRATVQSDDALRGSGKNPDTAMKYFKEFTAKIAPMIRAAQDTQAKVDTIMAENTALKARITHLENQPMPSSGKPGKGGVTAVTKSQDGGGAVSNLAESLAPKKSKFIQKMEAIPQGAARAEALLRKGYVSSNE